MKMSEEFPSKYIKASDLQGKEAKVIMSNCEREEVGMKDGKPDYKPVLYIKGKDKGIVLNKTNAQTISDFYGDDTADWYDQAIFLYAVDTEYQGKKTQGLRVRIPTAKDNRPVRDPITSGPQPAREVPSDDIPF